MKFLANQKLATRISIITTIITLAGLLLLWFIVSHNTASMVRNDITNQMTDAVESRAAIISDYVAAAEEYMTAFALEAKYTTCCKIPTTRSYGNEFRNIRKISPPSRAFLKVCISPPRTPMS